jgi:hypothetical protein
MVKPDVDRLPTVPTDPPAAGPDRALDPPPPDAGPAAEPPLAAGELLLAAGELLLAGAEPPPVAALTMP